FALGSAMRPSATDKKSFSIVSCPILACSSFTLGPVSVFLSLEHFLCVLKHLFLPFRDLGRMHLKPLCQFRKRAAP
ncbi:MAG: hypothetical protein AB1805_08570, partial [Nitrospirota bacterium]